MKQLLLTRVIGTAWDWCGGASAVVLNHNQSQSQDANNVRAGRRQSQQVMNFFPQLYQYTHFIGIKHSSLQTILCRSVFPFSVYLTCVTLWEKESRLEQKQWVLTAEMSKKAHTEIPPVFKINKYIHHIMKTGWHRIIFWSVKHLRPDVTVL